MQYVASKLYPQVGFRSVPHPMPEPPLGGYSAGCAPMAPLQCLCSQINPQCPVFQWGMNQAIEGVALAKGELAFTTVRDVSELIELTILSPSATAQFQALVPLIASLTSRSVVNVV